jgi:hypothetical protein
MDKLSAHTFSLRGVKPTLKCVGAGGGTSSLASKKGDITTKKPKGDVFKVKR